MKKIGIKFAAALGVILVLQGQAQATTYKQVRFLGLGEATCRSIAMGEAFVAVSDDASGVFWNPAGLAKIPSGTRYGNVMLKANMRNELAYDSVCFSGQSYEDYDEATFTIGDYLENKLKPPKGERIVRYNWGFGAISVNGDDQFRNTNLVFAAARGFDSVFWRKNSRLSGGLKLRWSNYDNYMLDNRIRDFNETTLGIGAMYEYSDFLSIGFTVDNVFRDGPFYIPSIASLGFAFHVDPTTVVACDGFNLVDAKSLDNINQDDTEFRIGVEKSFLDKDLTLRFGSKNGNLNLGFEMRITENFNVEYAYMGDYDTDVNQHFVGAEVVF
ncbi:MAG: hypothetical protein PHQ23_14115 [Candidatus Wallbacteria bacterium]|nr:hypothetical protein [Candidatus Wallbacteria bacterium]